jgi:hypothetical protein
LFYFDKIANDASGSNLKLADPELQFTHNTAFSELNGVFLHFRHDIFNSRPKFSHVGLLFGQNIRKELIQVQLLQANRFLVDSQYAKAG